MPGDLEGPVTREGSWAGGGQALGRTHLSVGPMPRGHHGPLCLQKQPERFGGEQASGLVL